MIYSETKSIGQYTSTKAVGSYARQDVTDGYKYKEGKVNERAPPFQLHINWEMNLGDQRLCGECRV